MVAEVGQHHYAVETAGKGNEALPVLKEEHSLGSHKNLAVRQFDDLTHLTCLQAVGHGKLTHGRLSECTVGAQAKHD